MAEQVKKSVSVQNDSFYNILAEILRKDRINSFDAYQIKVYLMKGDLLKTTNVEKRIIEYVYNNFKDWHTLIRNINACKIFLLLNETTNNILTISKKINIHKKAMKAKGKSFPERNGSMNRTTVRYWIGNLLKLRLITSNEFGYGREKMWRKDDQFEEGSNPNDLLQEDGLPKDKLKLQIIKLTAYFCISTIEKGVIDSARKKAKNDFSFLLKSHRKDYYV